MNAHRQETLSAPAGLLPAEQLEYWRGLALALYEPAKLISLRLCGGVTMPSDYIALNAAIAKAEGRDRG